MKPTLGLTGLTMNAMALIAPGAFLWLTFFIQATEGSTSPSMWIGIVFALLLCLATAVCYAEMAKLYPGTGSSYYFAEQSFLNHATVWRYARLSKFIVGWGSHLYYWIYPGVMVGVMGILCGYLAGTLWPNFINASNPGPAFMMAVAVAFSFAVAYIANRCSRCWRWATAPITRRAAPLTSSTRLRATLILTSSPPKNRWWAARRPT
jgi:amino acid transporter